MYVCVLSLMSLVAALLTRQSSSSSYQILHQERANRLGEATLIILRLFDELFAAGQTRQYDNRFD